MNRMRKEEPSGESQKPETCQDLLADGRTKSPSREASVKGFAASGDETETESSKMSKTSTRWGRVEKEMSPGRARSNEGRKTRFKSRATPRKKDFIGRPLRTEWQSFGDSSARRNERATAGSGSGLTHTPTST